MKSSDVKFSEAVLIRWKVVEGKLQGGSGWTNMADGTIAVLFMRRSIWLGGERGVHPLCEGPSLELVLKTIRTFIITYI